MVQVRNGIEQPADGQTRTELTLARVAKAWSSTERGSRFVRPTLDFLRSLTSPETLRAYSFSILELFDWYDRDRGRIPAPHEVSRADASSYAKWLAERAEGLTSWQLEKDPQRSTDKLIHDYLRRNPGSSSDAIRRELLRFHWLGAVGPDGKLALKMDLMAGGYDAMSRHLACLVRSRTVRRWPSIRQLRTSEVQVPGWETWSQAKIGLTVEPPASVFRYWTIEQSNAPSERSSTVALRLTALSSLWSYLMNAGENVGGQPLLAFNVWKEPLNAVRGQVRPQQAATRAEKTPDAELVVRMLATTFPRLGQAATEAARTVLFGGYVDELEPSFSDIRDRALILFMVQAGGPRVAEATKLKRRDIAGDPPIVTIIGKRQRKRQLRVPPAAMLALQRMWMKLERLANHQNRYYGRSRAEILLRDEESPLFPVVSHWGANAHANSLGKLSRQAVAMMLRRRAMAAGVAPSDPLFQRVHPHGLRHLFAQLAKSTTPVPKIQAMMGHASLTTTGRYVEERAPETLIADVFTTAPAMRPVPVPQTISEERVELPTRPRGLPEVVRTEAPASAKVRAEPQRAPVPAAPKAAEEPFESEGEPELRYENETLAEAPRAEEELAPPVEPGEAEDLPFILAEVYEKDWGERRSRTRLAESQFSSPRLLYSMGTAFSDLAEETLPAVAGIPEAPQLVEPDLAKKAKRLSRTYIGRSGMIWWSGTNGELEPEMPVLSRRQVGSCDATRQSLLCSGLLELWERWMQEMPTAASALVKWIVEAIDTAAQVDGALGGARWIEHEEQATTDDDVREHDGAQVLFWFEQVAWNYRESRGRMEGELESPLARRGRVIGSPLEAPHWYQEIDPIGSLPLADRLELLDLIGTLTLGMGHKMMDETPRYGRWSRKDVASFVLSMSFYDDAIDRLARAKRSGADISAERAAVERAESDVEAMARSAGADDFDIREQSKLRRTRQRAAREGRERRGEFYLRMAGSVFGEAVSTDPLLSAYAKTIPSIAGHRGAGVDIAEAAGRGAKPQASPILEDFRAFFAIDRSRQTIAHSEDQKRRFASQTGTHSEAVFRRIARHLWDLWHANNAVMVDVAKLVAEGVSVHDATKWLRGERGGRRLPTATSSQIAATATRAGIQRYKLPENIDAFDRRDYLVSLVNSMMAYRIPAPSAQEAELRRLLPDSPQPRDVFETWRLYTKGKIREEYEPAREPDEEFAGAQEAEARSLAASGRVYSSNPRRIGANKYTPNAAKRMPSPLLLVLAARTR